MHGTPGVPRLKDDLLPEETEVTDMPRTLPASGIPDGFGYGKYPELRKWIESEYPQLDPEKTMSRFIDYAEDSGRMATIWTACFKRVIRTGVEKKYDGIVVYKEGRAADPKWIPILSEVELYGFRGPLPHETPDTYRTQFNFWKAEQKRAPVIQLGSALRGFGK